MIEGQIQILVVDDAPIMRKLLGDILHKMGFQQIVEASNGQEAMTRIEHGGIDLVLTDWHMDESSGIELLKAIRNDRQFKTLPVLMITAERNLEMVKYALQVGATGYIIKPYDAKKIREGIESAIKKIKPPAKTEPSVIPNT